MSRLIIAIPLSSELGCFPNQGKRRHGGAGAPESEAEVMRQGWRCSPNVCRPAGRPAWSRSLDRSTLASRSETRAGASSNAGRRGQANGRGPRRRPSTRASSTRSHSRSQMRRASLVARYLSAPVRAKLTAAGLSYIDATGNMRSRSSSPACSSPIAVRIATHGVGQDALAGHSRVSRRRRSCAAIADFTGTWTIRELVDVSKASTGATYRVVEFLEREGMASRDATDGSPSRTGPRCFVAGAMTTASSAPTR